MSQEIRLNGYILKTQELGEADLLLTFFSEQQGKVRLVVKSAKKITSRLAGQLQPTNCLDLTLAGNGNLPKLIGAQTQTSYVLILSEQDAMAALQAMQELVNRALPDGQPNQDLFASYGMALAELVGRGEAPALTVARFFTKALQSLGFAPRLLAEQHPQSVYFSQLEARFATQPSSSDDLLVDSEVYELYLKLLREELINFAEFAPATPPALLKFLNLFASYQLERPLFAAQYFWQAA